MNFRSANKLPKVGKLRLRGAKCENIWYFGSARRNVQAARGGKEGTKSLRICQSLPEVPKNSGILENLAAWQIWQRCVWRIGQGDLENLAVWRIWKFDRRVGSKIPHAVRGGRRTQSRRAFRRPFLEVKWCRLVDWSRGRLVNIIFTSV